MKWEKKWWAYPDVELGSTSGHDNRRLQNTSGGRSVGAAWWTGELRCLNEPFRGGAKHSSARDCRRMEPWLCGGVTVPGAGTTFGKPANQREEFCSINVTK